MIKQYIADAFTDTLFHGNPAAVCVVDAFPEDALMQNIAKENRFSETAFTVKEPDGTYRLRWFTPGGEIDLCGHATLATGFVLFSFYEKDKEVLVFHTMSGDLAVTKDGDRYAMDFPANRIKEIPVTEDMTEALGTKPSAAFLGRDLLLVYEDEKTVRSLAPDQEKMKALPGLLVNVTAPGNGGIDSVSRSFAPKLAVAEDPVCGSGHCHIVPYWAKRLQKSTLTCCQASERGGTLYCTLHGERITMAGRAVLYSTGALSL